MATPTTEQIISKATEMWHNDRAKTGDPTFDIEPELEELKESGYLSAAMSELMLSERHKYAQWMESENESKSVEEKARDLTSFPLDAIMREGSVIVGGRGCGKSNLAKQIVRQALTQKIQVKVIDASLAWKGFPLLKHVKVSKGSVRCDINTVYDLSRLSVLESREFVSIMMLEDTLRAIRLTDLGVSAPLLYVLEEMQNLIFPNTLRALKYQDVSRFVTQGRNFRLSYLGICQRLGAVDANLIEISGVKYWLKLEGENSLRKARAWLSKFHTMRLRDLGIGEAYQQIGSRADLVKIPRFESVLQSVRA